MKKRKPIALATEIQREKEETDEEEKSESDVAFLARKIKKFIKKKMEAPRKRTIDRGDTEKEKEREIPTCYECKGLRHLRSKCLNLRKRHLW